MGKIFLARQKIVNNSGKTFGHELLFRDTKEGIKHFPTHLKATSQVMLTALTHMNFNVIMGRDSVAFINVDCEILESEIIELLDPNRCVIEILEGTQLRPQTIERIAYLKSKGYKIALDDFDCSAEMLKKFQPIFKYLSILKIDAATVCVENLKKLLPKFKRSGLRLLIEKIENTKEYLFYKELGFDLYQGFHIGRPEVMELEPIRDAVEAIVLKLISIIRNDKETVEIEKFIKQRPELAYNIIKFINNQKVVTDNISSIVQAVTLMGRDQLLRWLLVYLYSEVSDNEFSEPLLKAAIARAERMEAEAEPADREQAFMVGMFSMLDKLFDTDIENIFEGLKLDNDVHNAIIHKKGKFSKSLLKTIEIEKDHFKEIFMKNFNKIDSADLLLTLEKNHIKY